MLAIDAANAEDYLRRAGWIGPSDMATITPLPGGVSNEVLYVAVADQSDRTAGPSDFVLKQARPQLRVADPWFCGVDRIWREVEVLRICQRVLEEQRDANAPQVRTPRILFEDRENYCFGMEAAPRAHAVWKGQLLADVSTSDERSAANAHIAGQCGRLLGALHAGTWRDATVAAALDDRRIFDELRLDPYYRTVARRFPDDAPLLLDLVSSVERRRLCLVHADFSPKNLLVFPGGLMMVDFETGHYGDPAFDLGFFLSHLVLKSFYHAPRHEPLLALTERFWEAYARRLALVAPADDYDELVAQGIAHFAGCAWARLDGKSPVDYLTDEARRGQVRELCRDVLRSRPRLWRLVLESIRRRLDS